MVPLFVMFNGILPRMYVSRNATSAVGTADGAAALGSTSLVPGRHELTLYRQSSNSGCKVQTEEQSNDEIDDHSTSQSHNSL